MTELKKWVKTSEELETCNRHIISNMDCQTNYATHLCIFQIGPKLSRELDFSIGASNTKEKEDFWFFGNTSFCHGNNYLINLFVIAQKDVRFSLHLPKNGNNLKDKLIVNVDKTIQIADCMKEYVFSATKKEVVFIKSYRFTSEDAELYQNYNLLIPIKIEIHKAYKVRSAIVDTIKLKYTMKANETLYKTRNEGDFILESAMHKKHRVHSFVAAAHSPNLSAVVKSKKKSYFLNYDDEEVEMIVRFLYHGAIENLSADKGLKMLLMADNIGLPGMFMIGQRALSSEINTDNAVEIAVMAKKYNLKSLSLKVFQFIKQNPELLLSSSIEHLNDIDLMREMLQHIGSLPCRCNKKQLNVNILEGIK